MHYMVADDDDEQAAPAPTRSQVAEYIHDIAGQLATMARQAGLPRTAERLASACSVLEGEF
ncbi:MAG: hypothetical protein ABL871_04850 [Terricaulis sp.]